MKEYKTIADLIALMTRRGLEIDRPIEEVRGVLEGINYYRLTGYALPFLSDRERFKSGAKFSEVMAIYDFDRKVRDKFSEALEVVELTFRTFFARELGKATGALGYRDAQNYTNAAVYSSAIRQVLADYDQSKERRAQHFRRQGEHPPVWAIVEVASFGHLSYLFRALKPELRKPIADLYGFTGSQFFSSILQHLCVLRNRCAHHSRIYDLPWGQRDEAKDVSLDPEEASRRKQLYIFPELKEWQILKRNGFRIENRRPLFYQAALIYRVLKMTPKAAFDHLKWKQEAAALFRQDGSLKVCGSSIARLLGIPSDPLSSPLW